MTESNSPESVQTQIITRIENLIKQENAGHLDKSLLDYFEWRMIEVWRDAELFHERIFRIYTKALFEALIAARSV